MDWRLGVELVRFSVMSEYDDFDLYSTIPRRSWRGVVEEREGMAWHTL